MLASAVAAESGMRVILFEAGKDAGRKLRITGKGRCNLTNNCSPRQVIENIPTNGKFMFGAVNGLTPADTMRLFENLGVPLKTERGNRVFPQSDSAADVVDALRRYMENTGVTVVKSRALDIDCDGGRVSGVKTAAGYYKCRWVLLCTGGLSYPKTGSTGDGYLMAQKLGHRIVKPKPSLVPLVSKQRFCAEMQGLALKNVKITVYDKADRHIYEDFGEMLFTHFGVSGPIVLSASAHMRDMEKNGYYIRLDLKPALDEKKLDLRILRDFEKYSNRDFINALGDLLNRKMIPVVVKLTGIPPETKVHSITREQRMKLVSVIKGLRIDIDRPRPVEEAIITSGGVDVRDINPSTMESKLINGLYFAGEIIDVDAYTGGFNLQIAWSTAYQAAENIRERYYEE